MILLGGTAASGFGRAKASLFPWGGVGVKFKITGGETGHAFSIVEHPVAPRTLVPPHVHHDTDEYSYVVEGQFGARIGDEIFLADPGDYVLKPRGIPPYFLESHRQADSTRRNYFASRIRKLLRRSRRIVQDDQARSRKDPGPQRQVPCESRMGRMDP